MKFYPTPHAHTLPKFKKKKERNSDLLKETMCVCDMCALHVPAHVGAEATVHMLFITCHLVWDMASCPSPCTLG